MSPHDALLARVQRTGRLPSVVGGLVEDGRLSWVGAAGPTSYLPSDPADTQYRIGSITKTLTAVLVLQARDEGLVDLDAPLSAYVREAPYADRTLRAVLSHTAGIPAEPAGPWWERSTGGTFADLVAANAGIPAMAAEGAEFRYSNLGYALLGEVLARVRGASWWDLVRSGVLEPLGMTRTTYAPTAPHASGWSVNHLLGTLTPEPASDTGAMAPAGQVWSTVGDLAAYAGFVLHGHPDVLGLSTLEEMSAPVTVGEGGYGLGFRRPFGPDSPLVGHTGTMPGFRASFFCDRTTGRAYVGFTNATLGQASAALAAEMLALDPAARESATAMAPWTPTTTVPDDVREVVGAWYWGETQHEARWSDGLLELVDTRAGTTYETYARRDGRWIGTDRSELEVVREPDGSVAHLLDQTYLLTRTPYDPASPVPGGAPTPYQGT